MIGKWSRRGFGINDEGKSENEIVRRIRAEEIKQSQCVANTMLELDVYCRIVWNRCCCCRVVLIWFLSFGSHNELGFSD